MALEAARSVDSVMPPTETARPRSVARPYASMFSSRTVSGKHACATMTTSRTATSLGAGARIEKKKATERKMSREKVCEARERGR
eukprot:6196550-Pleurochrysis_carterae.AAC.1